MASEDKWEPFLRIDRDDLFIQVARLFARRSTCERGQVGCIAVQDRRIVASGYNGSPPKASHCSDVGCDLSAGPDAGCQRAIHAEANVVAWAARAGVSLKGATIYSTHAPCLRCAQLLVSAGIYTFIFEQDYRAERLDILMDALVEIYRFADGRVVEHFIPELDL